MEVQDQRVEHHAGPAAIVHGHPGRGEPLLDPGEAGVGFRHVYLASVDSATGGSVAAPRTRPGCVRERRRGEDPGRAERLVRNPEEALIAGELVGVAQQLPVAAVAVALLLLFAVTLVVADAVAVLVEEFAATFGTLVPVAV